MTETLDHLRCPSCETRLGKPYECEKCSWVAAADGNPDETPGELESAKESVTTGSDTSELPPTVVIDSRHNEVHIGSSKDSPIIVGDKVEGNLSKTEVNIGQLLHLPSVGLIPHSIDESRTISWSFREYSAKFQSEYVFPTDHTAKHLVNLTKKRLLILNCHNDNIANDAAYTLAKNLGGMSLKKVLFETENKDENQNIFALLRQEKELFGSAVIVDCVKNGGALVQSLLTVDAAHAERILSELDSLESYLVFLIAPDENSYSGASRYFPYWNISYLELLIKKVYPANYLELAEKVSKQRSRGKWAAKDDDFFIEIESYVTKQTLELEIESREANSSSTNEIFSAKHSKDSIFFTAVYAATYFCNVSLKEFGNIMEALLGDQEKEVIISSDHSVSAPSEISSQVIRKKLITIWKEPWEADQYLKDCHIEVLKMGGEEFVGYINSNTRQQIKSHLENHFNMFLQSVFERVWSNNLVFNKSIRIATNALDLTITRMEADPSNYGSRWFGEKLYSLLASGSNDSVLLNRAVYSLQRLLLSPKLKHLVDELLNYGLAEKHHGTVLQLVWRLRSDEFNFYYWVQQLLNRSVKGIQDKIAGKIYGLIEQRELSIYDWLSQVRSWLPNSDSNYSPAAVSAFEIVIQYCLASGFLLKEIEDCNSDRILFPSVEIETAKKNLGDLLSCVFHDLTDSILTDAGFLSPMDVQAKLILKWSLAFSRDEEIEAVQSQPANHTNNKNLSSAELLNLLLIQISQNLSQEKQSGLLSIWRSQQGNANDLLANFRLTGIVRTEIVVVRNCLNKLIINLKSAQKQWK